MNLSQDSRGFWPEEGVYNAFAAQDKGDTVRKIVADYRHTFLRDKTTKHVLTHLLAHLCFYRDVKTEEERIRHNIAKEVLSFIGLWGSDVGIEEEFVKRMSGFDLTEFIEGEEDAGAE